MEKIERRKNARKQHTISMIVNIGTIVAFIITASIIFGNLQKEHVWFRADIETLQECHNQERAERIAADQLERTERAAEYIKLQLKMIDLQVQLEHIATGQEWVISRLKGEI